MKESGDRVISDCRLKNAETPKPELNREGRQGSQRGNAEQQRKYRRSSHARHF